MFLTLATWSCWSRLRPACLGCRQPRAAEASQWSYGRDCRLAELAPWDQDLGPWAKRSRKRSNGSRTWWAPCSRRTASGKAGLLAAGARRSREVGKGRPRVSLRSEEVRGDWWTPWLRKTPLCLDCSLQKGLGLFQSDIAIYGQTRKAGPHKKWLRVDTGIEPLTARLWSNCANCPAQLTGTWAFVFFESLAIVDWATEPWCWWYFIENLFFLGTTHY